MKQSSFDYSILYQSNYIICYIIRDVYLKKMKIKSISQGNKRYWDNFCVTFWIDRKTYFKYGLNKHGSYTNDVYLKSHILPSASYGPVLSILQKNANVIEWSTNNKTLWEYTLGSKDESILVDFSLRAGSRVPVVLSPLHRNMVEFNPGLSQFLCGVLD